jgi:U6 snRNA-associated Sm-like protein LSm4
LVELKNGETFNGHLVNCDNWMNLTLREVIQTSPVRSFENFLQSRLKTFGTFYLDISFIYKQEGDRFWRLPECYIRGNTVNIYFYEICISYIPY